jgi:hypothetical protein
MKDRMIIIREQKPLIVSFRYTRSRLETKEKKAKKVSSIVITVN